MKLKNVTRQFKAVLIMLPLLLLGGCGTFGSHDTAVDQPAEPVAVYACGTAFDAEGRLSLQYTLAANDREESLHGKFAWYSRGESGTQINFYTPIGQLIAQVAFNDRLAYYNDLKQKRVETAATPDELVLRRFGWPLPVSGMEQWLQGCSTNQQGQPFVATPDQNAVTTQDGWHIVYQGWNKLEDGMTVPKRIDLTHTPDDAQASVSRIEIRVVIDSWKANQP